MATEPNQATRMLFRAAVMRQAVELGMTAREAIALIDRLHASGKLNQEADTLDSMLATLINQAVTNHAVAVVLIEQAKAAAGLRDVNPCLVLTSERSRECEKDWIN